MADIDKTEPPPQIWGYLVSDRVVDAASYQVARRSISTSGLICNEIITGDM